MPQSTVLQPVDIYNTLHNDSTFMSYVGDYTFTDSNVQQKAFSIVTPNKPIPNLKYVNGLEVVIHDTGAVTSRVDYLTDASQILVTYQIYLILWDSTSANGSNLTNASVRIASHFSSSKTIGLVPVRDTVNVLVQSLVEVPNNAKILY